MCSLHSDLATGSNTRTVAWYFHDLSNSWLCYRPSSDWAQESWSTLTQLFSRHVVLSSYTVSRRSCTSIVNAFPVQGVASLSGFKSTGAVAFCWRTGLWNVTEHQTRLKF